jgi:hypothetical protein
MCVFVLCVFCVVLCIFEFFCVFLCVCVFFCVFLCFFVFFCKLVRFSSRGGLVIFFFS